MFRPTKSLTVIVASLLSVGMTVGLPRDCSAWWSAESSSDAVLACLTGGWIVRIDPQGNQKLVATVFEWPESLVVSRDGRRAYVAIRGGVVAIDLLTSSIAGRVPLSGEQIKLTLTGNGSRLYAAYANEVSIIDTATLLVVGRIPHKELLVSDAVVTPDGAMLYVSHEYYSGLITLIDTARQAIVGKITTPGQATALALTEDGRRLCVTQALESKVFLIDTGTNEIAETFEVGDKPSDIAVFSRKDVTGNLDLRVLVANFGSQSVSILGGPIVVTVTVRTYPARLAVPPSGSVVYVMHNGDSDVGIIDAESGAARFVKLSGVPVSLSRQPFASDHGVLGYRRQAYDALAGLVPRRTRVLTALAALATCVGAMTARVTRSLGVILFVSFGLAVAVALMTWFAVPATVPHIEYIYAAHRPLPAVIWPVLAFAGGGTLSLAAALISRVISARKSRVTSTIADVDSGPRSRPK